MNETQETPTDVQQMPDQETASDATPLRQIRLRPDADIYRGKDAVRVIMDLPGAREEDLDIELHDGVLSIEARVQRDDQEIRQYERSFRLDRKLNAADIQATLEHGVLHLRIPFHEEAKPKKIKIQTS